MKKKFSTVRQLLSALSVSALIVSGCSKSGVATPDSQSGDEALATTASLHHTYGVLPPDPAHFSTVPSFTASEINVIFRKRMKPNL